MSLALRAASSWLSKDPDLDALLPPCLVASLGSFELDGVSVLSSNFKKNAPFGQRI